MTKNRWRESIKTFENHIDPEKNEELRGTKIEIDEKVTKIVKLVRNKNKQDKKDGNSRKDSQIVEFVQDFQKQYQSLYTLYDNLRGEVTEKVHGREEEGSSSSTSNSDSESYYSPVGIGGKTSPSKSEFKKVKANLKQKLETSHLEVTDLRNKLTSVTEEKEALNSEYMVSLSKIQESEEIIKCLRIEADQTESIKQKLMDESNQLKEQLAEKEKELLSLIKTHQAHESEASAQIMEFGSQVTSMKLELETLCTQKQELKEQIVRKATEARQVGDGNLVLKTRILELEMTSKEKEDELSTTVKKFEDNENNLKSKIEDLMAQVNNMQLEVDTLRTQKDELEKCVVCKSNEASAQVRSITGSYQCFAAGIGVSKQPEN
ncbi:hypothetical protein F0562_011598 [Nyssa sinensis]|uniref:NAB domain-containing protein n=1 Tax=Nyssa sinensis TaxID=561372 RepID=A0A5J4ZQE8_9ASTE|nr:hypothetical protein F0562_011598 [Nyssa sinensis]